MRDRECKCKRDNTTPKEWNYAEITAYQFGSTDKFEDYLQTGGTHLYNDKFQEKDHMIKITVADSGYFTIATQTDGNRSQKVKLYDSTKEKVLAQTTSDGDLEYGRLAKAGEVFYLQMPEKIDKIFVTTGVIKDGFGSMKASDTYYESGTGSTTYHPFQLRRDLRWNLTFQRSIETVRSLMHTSKRKKTDNGKESMIR